MSRENRFSVAWICAGACLVFAVSLAVYIFTLSPTISVGDSPELISSAHTLGIAHPPGYPLFSILGKGFSSLLPFIPVAKAINLFSSLMAAAAVVLIYMAIIETIALVRNSPVFVKTNQPQSPENRRHIYHDVASSALGALTFAFSGIFWSQAVVAEVYSLNSAFFALMLWLSLRWMREAVYHAPDEDCCRHGGDRTVYLIAFLWGLSLSNHHLMLPFGPLFLVSVGMMVAGRRLTEGSRSMEVFFSASFAWRSSLFIFFFILGVSVYIYMPLRSAQDPFMDWGDAERATGFLEVILRKQFGLGSRNYGIDRLLNQSGYYLSMLREQFSPAGIIVGVAGALLFIGRMRSVFLFTSLLFLVQGILAVFILNPAQQDLYTIDVMMIPSFIIFSVWAGLGYLTGYGGITSLFVRSLAPRFDRHITAALTILFLSVPLTLLVSNFRTNDESNNSFARDYARDVLEGIDQDGVVFVEADISLFPLWYMQYVENVRRDVAVLDVDMLMLPWFKAGMRERYPVEIKVPDIVRHAKGKGFSPLSQEALISFKVSQAEGMLDDLMDRYPLYLSYEFGVPFAEFGERKDINIVQDGVVFRVSREPLPVRNQGPFHAVESLSILKAVSSGDDEVLFVGRAYLPSMERRAALELSHGKRAEAMGMMEGIEAIDPYNPGNLNNLAYLYAEEGRELHRAEYLVRRAISINPIERNRYMKTLGYVYLKMKEYDKAIRIFTDVLKAEPDSRWTKGMMDEAVSERSEARR